MTDEGDDLEAAGAGGLKDIQKKTFTKWINSQLERSSASRGGRMSVTDLYYDLRDGRVLLEVLEVMTGKKIPRERGSLRIHQISNVTTALKVIRDEQKVSLVSISAVDIVDGNPKMTLALVWNMVLCYQFHKVLKTLPISDMERALLAWCRKSVSGLKPAILITDFSRSFSDGLAFNAILHNYRPNLFDMDLVYSKTPLARLDFAFRMMNQHLGLARLLDPEDIQSAVVDKKSVMTYVICMYQVFPHDDDVIAESNSSGNNNFATMSPASGGAVHPAVSGIMDSGARKSSPSSGSSSVTASPLKVPPKVVTKGKFYNYDSYCSMYEDVFEWILEAFDDLNSMDDLADDLVSIKCQVDVTMKYMDELNKYQPSIGEVLKVGRRLLEDGLNTSEANDVRVRGNLLNGKWEELRQQALTRQKELFDKLMSLQQIEMQNLREWMTEIEDRISRMGGLAGNLKALAVQEEERNALERDLEKQLPMVSRVSHFIFLESDSSSNSPSDTPDLEGQVMAQGERWNILCAWVEDRAIALARTRLKLEDIENDRSQLDRFLTKCEESLRQMERNPSTATDELLRQARCIKSIQHETEVEQERLSKMDLISEEICNSLDPHNKDRQVILKTVEGLQDRWDIFTQILEAQTHRISSFGIELGKVSEDSDRSTEQEISPTSNGTSSTTDETASKKRKITGTKRIEFETAYARVASWLHSTIEMVTPAGPGDLDLNIVEEENLLKRVESEIEVNATIICQTVEMGENLMREIQSEADYPPGYLNNVTEKVTSLKFQLSDIETRAAKMREKLNYRKSKDGLYVALEILRQFLFDNLNYLSNLRFDEFSDKEEVDTTISECATKQSAFESQSTKIDELRRLAGEATLHPGAISDPSNTIKSDLYKFCESWEELEKEFSTVLDKLRSAKQNLADVSKNVDIFVDDVHVMEDQFLRMKKEPTIDENLLAEYESLMSNVKRFNEEVEGLNVWMKEVDTFLKTEHTASSDPVTLEAQLKESSSLQDDLITLQPTVDAINDLGIRLLHKTHPNSRYAEDFEKQLREINAQWEATVRATRQQYANFSDGRSRLQEIVFSLDEIESFINHVEHEAPVLTQHTELPQLKYKLLHFKDKIERKKQQVDKVAACFDSSPVCESLQTRWAVLRDRWEAVCSPVVDRYRTVKLASREFGEFNALAAQEKDCLERLEKKLNRSVNTAADAEEISEELVDIENFLTHHPEHRLPRIKELALALTEKNILPASVVEEAEKLDARWKDLSNKARQRTTILEGSIAEAQEWELKIIEVQEWLTERDMLITSHLDHDLTVDDLPDESQREMMLREFEDKENQMAELDEQVDAYREAGKLEAAARLEDQLHLIHGRFQELSMKFELFQQHPAVEYEPHLDRVTRQLRDIREKMYLTELASYEKEGIEGQLNHATCIINALSDIKPEIENVIKMGRKIVESEAVVQDKENLSRKIDALKKDFNATGTEVSDAKDTLEKAQQMSVRLNELMTSLRDWLSSQIKEISRDKKSNKPASHVIEIAKEMTSAQRTTAEEILEIRNRFYEMCNPSLLVVLKENVQSLGEKWSELSYLLAEKAADLDKVDEADLAETLDSLAFNPFQLEERKTSSVAASEDGPLLEEFRSAFQEVSQWIDSAEAKLLESRKSEERALGREIEEWRPKVGNLRTMAEKLVQIFVGQKNDVEPEMEILGQRWNEIVKDVEDRLASNRDFKMVEVENIRTTISHLRIPASEPVITMSSAGDPDEEIVTLAETPTSPIKPSSPFKRHRPEERPNGRQQSKKPSFGRETNTLLSSGDSSPDPDSPENRRLSGSGEKVPPKTYPKPEWYVKARKLSPVSAGAPLLSPERVKVVVSSLPSPQKVSATNHDMVVVSSLPSPQKITSTNHNNSIVIATTQVHVEPQAQMAQREIFPPSSPSSCSPMSNRPDDNDEEEEDLARDNATIDRLLLEATADLAEVSRKVSRSGGGRDTNVDKLRREISDFESSASAMIGKMRRANKRLNELDEESDLRLRQDLIDMESRELEAEVATHISRGDTLVLMTDRHDVALGRRTQETVQQLRQQWQLLKQQADKKKSTAKNYEDKLDRFRTELNDLKTWLCHTLRQMTWASANNHDKIMGERLRRDAEFRKPKLKELNAMAASLKGHSALGGQELALTVLNADWEDMERKLRVMTRDNETVTQTTVTFHQESPPVKSSSSSKSPASQISARIDKMRDVLATLERQLASTVLAGKPFEDLEGQSEVLETVHQALEKLRATSKRIEKDLEVLYGTLSMEYFEKITGQIEKFRKEMERANQKYVERKEQWRKCVEKRELFDQRRKSLLVWLAEAESRVASITSKEASDTGKGITDFAILAKEIASRTSPDEGSLIQTQTDEVIQKWKVFLRIFAESKNPPIPKELERLLHWVDTSLVALQKAANFNDLEEAEQSIKILETINRELPSRREDAEKLADTSVTTRSIRTGIEKITILAPKRLQILKERLQRIEAFRSDLKSAEEFCREAESFLEEAKSRNDVASKQDVLNKLHLNVENRQYEVNAILSDYVTLEKEAKNDQLSQNVHEFKERWLKLRHQVRLAMSGLPLENSIPHRNGTSIGDGPGSTASVSSCETTHETQASRTTYYNSQASFQTEEADQSSSTPPPSKDSAELKELEEILNQTTQEERLPVHDCSEIRASISRQMAALRNLDSKRIIFDKISARDWKNEEERIAYQSKLNKLRERFDERKHEILSRKSECTAMAGLSEQYVRKVKEIETWMSELEGQLARLGPMGATVDVIEEQQEDILNALKKLSKYNHHIQLFTQTCQKLTNLYGRRDDVSEIERTSNDLSTRYANLNDKFTSLKKDVQKARHSFTSFDKSVGHFLGWLSEMESNVDNLEFQVESSQDGLQDNLPGALDDIKKEMLAKDREFNALSRFGDKLLRSLSQDEKVVLAQRLSEVNQRWKALQNKMLNFGASVDVTSTLSSPASAAAHRIPAIHATIRDHQDWVLRKKRELDSLRLAGDVTGLQKQLDENSTFRDHVEDRGNQVKSSLSTAKELQNGLIDTQGFQVSVSSLERDFSALVIQTEDWNNSIVRALVDVKGFEDEIRAIENSVTKLESKESLVTNGLDALEPGIHLDEVREMSAILDALTQKCDDLTRRSKEIASLSHTNQRRLHMLSGRLASLRVVLERRRVTATPSRIVANGHPSDAYLSDNLPPGWERSFTDDDIPYYVDNSKEETCWDHPEFTELMTNILELNVVKFSAYRLATKLRAIQRKLRLDLLDIEVAHQGFEEHGLTSSRHEMTIRIPELILVLSSLFETLKEEEGPEEIDARLCTELTLNLLLNIYDGSRMGGQLRVFSFKLAILALCRGPLTEKFIYLFNLASAGSPTQRIDPRQLGLLLYDCMQIPKLLGEVAAFGGSNVEPSVRSCFMFNVNEDHHDVKKTPTTSAPPADIDCKHFLRWVKCEPQCLVWFPVLQRLSSAELACHYVKCKGCKMTPITGFRYHCAKCFNFDLCQTCFFVGLTAKGHKADHPMEEYCTSTGKTDNFKIFGKALRNSLRRKNYFKKKHQKLGYLPVNSVLEGEDFSSPIVSPNLSSESRDFKHNSSSGSIPKKPIGRGEVSEEHDLIAKLCQHLHATTQESSGASSSDRLNETPIERQDLVQMITELEEEHARLLSEHDELSRQLASFGGDVTPTLLDESKLREEKRILKQDTQRMDARMNILEDHNRQLVAQLQRLRQLLLEQPASLADVSSSSQSGFGTLQSKSVVAADLHVHEHSQKEAPSDRRMPPPGITKSKVKTNGTDDGATSDSGSSLGDGDDYQGAVAGKVSKDNHSQSSLDLSDHETQREYD